MSSHDEQMYKNKYLKYKNKYIQLKEYQGGGDNILQKYEAYIFANIELLKQITNKRYMSMEQIKEILHLKGYIIYKNKSKQFKLINNHNILKKMSKSVSKSVAKSATKTINSMKFDLKLSTSVEKIYNHIKDIIELCNIISDNNVDNNIKDNINTILYNETENFRTIQLLDQIIKKEGFKFKNIKLDRNVNTDTNSLPSSINYNGDINDNNIQNMISTINDNTNNSINNIECVKIFKDRGTTEVKIVKIE
jgi:hypothetical protein